MIRPPLDFYRVSGESMAPSYHDGDVLLGTGFGRAKLGEVVVVLRDIPIVKRITHIDGNRYWIEGDNASASTDSREFGWVESRDIVARILGRIAKG